ncbi:C2H2-type zinc finger protein [Micromonospora sp. 15K316]|uniref:C2H2-type zinc finger protein n=1 Tax=Micromonospora sp. 15K316 TaxID=2530376 RepID=UPI001A9CF3F7|nr:C2H2-type zinc finger protein [Micromonospora sp. 15K316]
MAWAVKQQPKTRSVGLGVIAVAAELFPEIPEALLVGARVDGQPYVPVPVPAGPPDDVVELLGVYQPPAEDTPTAVSAETVETSAEQTGVPERTSTPDGGPLPPLPESAYSDDAVPLPEADPAGHQCDHCGRTFGSARGLNAHTRQAHTDSEG